jgi:hypothetical protein
VTAGPTTAGKSVRTGDAHAVGFHAQSLHDAGAGQSDSHRQVEQADENAGQALGA